MTSRDSPTPQISAKRVPILSESLGFCGWQEPKSEILTLELGRSREAGQRAHMKRALQYFPGMPILKEDHCVDPQGDCADGMNEKRRP